MNRKQFTLIYGAILNLVHPVTRDNMELSIASAAKFYDTHENMHKAKAVNKKVNKADRVSWFKKLTDENPRWLDWFLMIRKAFNHGSDREKSAEQFLLLCRTENPSDEEFKHWRYAAEQTCNERPHLDHTAIHFNQWLKNRVFDGYEMKTDKEIVVDKKAEERRELMADLNHFKGQLKQSPGDAFLESEVERIQGLIDEAV